jgi:DNA-binding transcriptional regulator YdaS (Cro superfamily)
MTAKQRDALARAIGCFETQADFMAAIGFSRNALRYWRLGSKKGVPAEACVEIERVTKGRVRACELRPDLYP